jgi:hypothetical protein
MNRVAVVTGIIIVVVIVGAYVIVTMTGNTEEALELNVAGGACTIVTNTADKDVSVKKNKKVTWAVKNACATEQTVMLGNFRTVQASTRTTCTDPTENASWPFRDQDQDQNKRSVTVPAGDTKDIVLMEAKNAGAAALTYYFDICVGGVKKDPRLVIEP